MSNKEIANAFRELAQLMELHEENTFKIRSYQNAYRNLRSLDQPLAQLSETEIGAIKGVGKAIQGKILELLEGGKMATLEHYRAATPEGVREMINIKGFGPKKIRVVWQDLGAESIGELLYAVNENRLVELKGFGLKTQEDLRQKLMYYQRSKNQFHFAALETEGQLLKEALAKAFPGVPLAFTGAFRRKLNILDRIALLLGQEGDHRRTLESIGWKEIRLENGQYFARSPNDLPICLYTCKKDRFGLELLRTTGPESFLTEWQSASGPIPEEAVGSEEALFRSRELPVLPPELRDDVTWLQRLRKEGLPDLLEVAQIKGVVHAHSTYSDGLLSIKAMAEAARSKGFEYLAMTDHSKSAFYANGLQPERVLAQMKEIDQLNAELAPFRILKGIESDILSDGSLDYEEALLAQFDLVIASVHSNLRMDEEKATNRLIKAIENPYTHILGHPTGRLLLSRVGYLIDYRKVIDACAANHTAIEINANPYRLDLDWQWIPYAMEKGVLISVNPDAHNLEGIQHIRYGVFSARKGGLTPAFCLNARNVNEFLEQIRKKRKVV